MSPDGWRMLRSAVLLGLGLGAVLGATDRAAVTAATVAVLLGWAAWALVVALDGDDAAVPLIAAGGLAAALCTATCSWAVLRRARPPS